ncbi:putative bifunctional diguanylate cyclase/phosphodiesterase [Kineosporia succinea]|uniref:Diguanylate cyclase (GGDEF)-like protein n=1 Tax=Kineosporia succinea TaxID=84632 RepID=A0ABT9PBC2_9ACTN|nr:EAL domain-containing protein [Kineosporia succinea]MDP9830006.1 diguanylate cyclase (GGDEF)-like protein [Kineosporia succinea]
MGIGLVRAYTIGIAVFVTAYWLSPPGVTRNLAQLPIALIAVSALVLAGVRDRPRRAAWLALATGAGLTFAGDLSQAVYVVRGGDIPFPSPADTAYLSGDVLLAVGLGLMQRGRPRDLAGTLDTLVVTVAGGLVVWLGLGAGFSVPDSPADLVRLAYPLENILLLSLAVWLLTSPPGIVDTPVARWLTLGTTGLLIGDTTFGLSGGTLTMQDQLFSMLYFVMYLGWTGAGLRAARHPGVTEPPGPARALSPARLLFLYAALFVVPGLLLCDFVRHVEFDHFPLATAAALLSLLVPARMWLSMHQLETSTRQRDAYREDLVHQAAHDPLTDLPNRAYLMELLAAQLQRARRSGSEVAVLFVDLDFFKRVNDQLGHAAGDEVLRTVTERMKGVLRAGDVIGRQGGDEFVVLIDPVPSPSDLMEIAERLVTTVSAPIMTSTGKAAVGASVGIALARDGQIDPEKLLQDADLAAYRAKSNGRGRAEIFDQALRTELEVRAKLEADIRAGLASDEFELHYQPVMSVADGNLRSYEALIRWRHPLRGMVPPNEFIPAAEESLLICEVGRWVLTHATRQLAEWTRMDPQGHGDVTVAVNISARHLASPSLVDEVRQALEESGLQPRRLVLEITETVLLDEPTADTHLRALRDLGVTVSLDDFGTGYTSIGQLQKLQVDTLKIDQSFLRSDDPATQSLVKLMITAAHAFNLDVVAEGVETQEQLDRLAAIGCELAQGYYLGRPKSAQETEIVV